MMTIRNSTLVNQFLLIYIKPFFKRLSIKKTLLPEPSTSFIVSDLKILDIKLQSFDEKDSGGRFRNECDQKRQWLTGMRQSMRDGTEVKFYYCKRQGCMIKDCWMKQRADFKSEKGCSVRIEA